MRFIFVLLCICLLACQPEQSDSTTSESIPKSNDEKHGINFSSVPANISGIDFKNKINESPTRFAGTYEYLYNGGGVAVGDFDNDGLEDVFFSGNDTHNAVYKNLGGLKFEDKSEGLPKTNQWCAGATTVDINNDGLLDIYVCTSGPNSDNLIKNILLINKGNFVFEDQAKAYGLDVMAFSVQAEFFDYDKDGDLDMWLNNHALFHPTNALVKDVKTDLVKFLNNIKSERDGTYKMRFFRNDGGTFTDISKEAGVFTTGFGLGLAVNDFNDDGYLDVYVGNDYWIPDYLFINDQKGGFVDQIDLMGHTPYYSMGCDAADYNNDGELDFMIVDMAPADHFRSKTMMASMDIDFFNRIVESHQYNPQYMYNSFQLGMGNGKYSDIALAANVSHTDWSWAPLLFDFDNNGYKDLYVTNGYYRDARNNDERTKFDKLKAELGEDFSYDELYKLTVKIPTTPIDNQIYYNTTNGFEDITHSSTNVAPSVSAGAAYADFDNDGDYDILICNQKRTYELIENKSISGNYLKVNLTSANTSNIRHSKVILETANLKQRMDYIVTRGYQSSVSHELIFGMAKETSGTLKIYWPNGTMSSIPVNTNEAITVDFDSIQKSKATKTNPKTYFDNASDLVSSAVHKEDFFNDFVGEVLLPHKYSSMGPALAVGDVNGDGKNDFFLGGSSNYAGTLYLQTDTGFEPSKNNAFKRDKKYEDLGATFLDYDNDNDLDLVVTSGGGTDVKSNFQDRLYQNDGQGKFIAVTNKMPRIQSSTKEITVLDIDNDGDQDLFIGGRNQPGKYPSKSKSYLLENNNGRYKNIMSPELEAALPNMITGIETFDHNNDGYTDLLIVGEWAAPSLFLNNKNRDFELDKSLSLKNSKGWWHSIKKADLNGDDIPDFVLGNLGMNNKFKPSEKKPLEVYFDDFDNNGTNDIFLAKEYKGRTVPVRGKECSSDQLPMINDKFDTYEAFASSSLGDILGEDNLKKAEKYSVTNFESSVLMSSPSGYKLKSLPYEAQWAPIMDIEFLDVNKDGHQDIIIGGNIVHSEPETPSYDAGKGTILINDGKGNLSAMIGINNTGLDMGGDTKAIESIDINGQKCLLVARNDDTMLLFKSTE